jgi:phosphate transport system permease protein
MLKRLLLIAPAVGFAVTVAFALTPLSGAVGWALCSYVGFVVAASLDTYRADGPVAAKDSVATVLVFTAGVCTVVPLVLIVGYVLSKGLPGITKAFFTETLEQAGPADPATIGGAQHAIIGTVQQVGLATVLSTPLGLLTAIHLNESRGPLARITLDQGFSGLAAAMALSVLMLPTIARTADEVINLVPDSLREASLALGAPQWKTVSRIVLPAARSGLVTATVLGVSRIAGETAPLLMTAFGSDGVNTNPFDGPQSSLPLFAFQRVRAALPTQIARGWAGALALIVLVLTLFTVARVIATRGRKAP